MTDDQRAEGPREWLSAKLEVAEKERYRYKELAQEIESLKDQLTYERDAKTAYLDSLEQHQAENERLRAQVNSETAIYDEVVSERDRLAKLVTQRHQEVTELKLENERLQMENANNRLDLEWPIVKERDRLEAALKLAIDRLYEAGCKRDAEEIDRAMEGE